MSHENRILQEQITLFINYISFFHISQQKQLKKLHIRIGEFYKEVDENINMNCTFSIDDISNDDSFDLIHDNDDVNNLSTEVVNDASTEVVIKTTEIPVILVTHNDDNNKSVITNEVVPLPAFKSLSDVTK